VDLQEFASKVQSENFLDAVYEVVDQDGWNPSHGMIDKSWAERNVLEEGMYSCALPSISSHLVHSSVWPDMTIRLCQFHIIKAITHWEKSKPKAAKGRKKAAHHGLTDESWPNLFRKAQRARSKESWKQTYSKSFSQGLHQLQREYGCNATVINEYFQDNWWNSWLGECMKCSKC
jgi:hypothetical protein